MTVLKANPKTWLFSRAERGDLHDSASNPAKGYVRRQPWGDSHVALRTPRYDSPFLSVYGSFSFSGGACSVIFLAMILLGFLDRFSVANFRNSSFKDNSPLDTSYCLIIARAFSMYSSRLACSPAIVRSTHTVGLIPARWCCDPSCLRTRIPVQ